ncbi:MAG: TIGR00341 family protein [Anaerolineales bacterium]|nr:TIGR00341 family protein [Anaerolineales bacterium]
MNNVEEPFLGEIRLPQEHRKPWKAAAPGLILGCALIYALTDLNIPFSPAETILAITIGGLAILLVLSSVLELLAGSANPAGIYGFVKEILNQPASFLGGWALFLGTSAASTLLAVEASHQITQMLPDLAALGMLLPLTLVALILLLELLPRSPLRHIHWSLLILVVVVCLIMVGQAWFEFQPEPVQSLRSAIDMNRSMRTAALLIFLFLPFETYLSSQQTRSSSKAFIRSVRLLAFGLTVLTASGLIFTARAQSLMQTAQVSIARMLAEYNTSAFLAAAVPLLAVLIGLRYSILTNTRQLDSLCRASLLPEFLRRIRKPFDMPVLLFLAAILPVPGWLLLRNTDLVLASGSSLILLTLLLLNIAAIRSRLIEPDRRRTFTTPLFPLIPAISSGLLISLLISTAPSAFLIDAVLLLAGAGLFFGYSRQHALAAREGSIRFTPTLPLSAFESAGSHYRILLPLTPGQERHLALKIAVSLAHQLGASLIPLQVIPIPDPLAMEEGRRLAKERNRLFQWSLSVAQKAGVTILPVTRFARNVSDGIIEAAVEEHADLILMPWTVSKPSRGVQLGHVLDPVLSGAQCDVAVVAFPEHNDQNGAQPGHPSAHLPLDIQFEFTPKRILVPTAGGPNAPLAFRFALSLANEARGSITAAYIAHPDATAEELAAGEQRINQTIQALKLEAGKLAELQEGMTSPGEISYESLVIKAESVVKGIAEAGESFDLVLLGASEERIIDQMLLGTIPEQVARSSPQPTIMVKRFRGLRRYWLQRIWKLFFELVPTLNSEERIEVYRTVRRDARPDIDYFIMMGLSAAIATFGLLQNSSAVIIGAMLVAPLFTPIVALSLAIVQGDMPLFRLAIESSIKGIALAIGLAMLLTSLSPLTQLTYEILVRSQPNMFDLLIALASGMAGAYAIAREDVATSLPGVAIAAALVPPLSAIGIGLAHGNLAVAGGSALLFSTNLIAIVLSGVITLTLLGFLPRKRGQQDIRLRWAFFFALLSLALILVPLVSISTQTLHELTTEQAVTHLLEEQVETEGLMIDSYEINLEKNSLVVSIRILAAQTPPPEFAAALLEKIEAVSEQPVTLNLTLLSVETIQSLPPDG